MKLAIAAFTFAVGSVIGVAAKDIEISLEPVWEKTAVHFEGKCNLPEGTQLHLSLMNGGEEKAVASDSNIVIHDQKFRSRSFAVREKGQRDDAIDRALEKAGGRSYAGDVGWETPLQGKYRVRLVAVFSHSQLMDCSSPYLKIQNPDLVDSDKIFQYEKEFDLQPKLPEADMAIGIVKGFYLTQDGQQSAWSVGRCVDDFVSTLEDAGIKVARLGWRASPIEGQANVYNVYYTYEYVDKSAGKQHNEAWFECDLNMKQVRARNKWAYSIGWIR